ncbi:hypothetical protein JNE181771_p20190 (plasmid) [Escherichia coli]|nr:hypothetical protein JNE181771_p20190 [Escherichia coli]
MQLLPDMKSTALSGNVAITRTQSPRIKRDIKASFSYRRHREGTPVVPVPRCLWAVHRVR